MENASKALIMAAGVLIGILVLSLGVYLFASFGNTSIQIHEENEANELNKFNSQFTVYQGRTDLTIYDILTVANYASENNKYYGLDKTNRGNEATFYVGVKLDGKYIEELNTKDQTYKIESFTNELNVNSKIELEKKLYKCRNKDVKISSITGRVYQIIFTQN